MEGTIEFSIRPKADRVDYEIWSQGQPEEFFVALAIVSNYMDKLIAGKDNLLEEDLQEVIRSRAMVEKMREQCADALKEKARVFRDLDEEDGEEVEETYE